MAFKQLWKLNTNPAVQNSAKNFGRWYIYFTYHLNQC